MTLKDAIKSSLTILKQVMEEKLNATNIEASYLNLDLRHDESFSLSRFMFKPELLKPLTVWFLTPTCLSLLLQLATIEPGKTFHMYSKEEMEEVIKDI